MSIAKTTRSISTMQHSAAQEEKAVGPHQVPRTFIVEYIKCITHVAEDQSAVTPAIVLRVVDFIQRLITMNGDGHSTNDRDLVRQWYFLHPDVTAVPPPPYDHRTKSALEIIELISQNENLKCVFND